MKKKALKFILKLAVSAGFLTWIIFKVNWREVLLYAREINSWQILLFVVVYSAGIFISGYKWKLIAREKEMDFGLWEFSKIYLTGTFINNFMPSFIGGDAYRSYQVGKISGNRHAEAASTVLVDRITGFLGIMVLALAFSLINLKTVIDSPLLIAANLLILASFGSDVFILILKKTFLWKFIGKIVPEIIIKVAQEVKKYNSSRGVIYKAVLWGVFFNFIGVGIANLILFWAFGIKIGFLNYFTVIFLISMVSAIPISINNIGIKEWAYITFFGIFGINSSAVVAIAIASRFLQMLISFLALPVYLKSQMKNKNIS